LPKSRHTTNNVLHDAVLRLSPSCLPSPNSVTGRFAHSRSLSTQCNSKIPWLQSCTSTSFRVPSRAHRASKYVRQALLSLIFIICPFN
jgi:hypothetical protein